MRWRDLAGRRAMVTLDGGDVRGVLGRIVAAPGRDGLVEVVDATVDGRPADGRLVVPVDRVVLVQVVD